MSARSGRPAGSTPPRAGARLPRIPLNLGLLLVSEDFERGLDARSVGRAIARGLRDGGLPEPDQLALAGASRTPGELRAVLEEQRLQTRMLAARALVIATAQLHDHTLAGGAAFELATRARQAGVPAYAVAGASTLDSFQARILDLQMILEASGSRGLADAGRRLAREVLAGIGPGRIPSAGSPGTRT